jgi:hypothetical protein
LSRGWGLDRLLVSMPELRHNELGNG